MMYMRKQMTFRMILSFMKMVSGSEVQDVLLVVQLKPGGAQQASSRHLGCRVAPSASGKDSKTDQAHRCSVLHCPLLVRPEHVHRPIQITDLALNFVAADETIATGGCDARSATPLMCCTLIALYDCATAALSSFRLLLVILSPLFTVHDVCNEAPISCTPTTSITILRQSTAPFVPETES
jgi:hypothetical protein